MIKGVALLLCLAALAVGAAARGTPATAGPARELLQSASDCARSVPNCVTCRFQFFRGTSTRAVCMRCDAGYAVAASGRACWCAPGFAWNATSSTCSPCGVGFHCPGARSTAASATRTSCGANKVTSTATSRSDRECVVIPGYGWAAGDSSAICAIGTFNPGQNTRACTRCSGGLTTNATGATSAAECIAPAGFYFLRGKAVACAQGTYKTSNGNRDCDKCPEGWTTAPSTVGATLQSQCSFVMPGYQASASVTPGAAALTQCAANSFRVGTVAYSSSAGNPCTPCPSGMQTLPGVQGSTSQDACLAPPGWGWSASTQTATICAVGTYNEGWSREGCKVCDAASGTITTAANGSASVDDCFTPAGHGNQRTANGALTGFACRADTYGRPNPTFGLVDVACDKCLENSSTRGGTASTSSDACVTNAGFGYDDGQVSQCDYGYWAAGGDRSACSACGEGYNTTANGAVPTTSAVQGASAAGQCAIAAGWTYADNADADKGLAPCTRGSYKELIGNATCLQCPAGTTTTITMAATARSDCDSCRPGFGTASVNLANPSCTMCTSGSYSQGFTTGGADCVPCPKPALFSGLMVSRNGISTPEDCVPQFPTDGDQPSYLPWDVIPMSSSYLAVQATVTSRTACQASCASDNTCQYFAWYNYNVTAGSQTQCFLRRSASAITRTALDPATATNTILFEVKEGAYAVYPAIDSADAANIGTSITLTGAAATTPSFANVRAFCENAPACVGIAVAGSAGTWRAFGGSKWEGSSAKIKVYGPTINSWVAEPTP